ILWRQQVLQQILIGVYAPSTCEIEALEVELASVLDLKLFKNLIITCCDIENLPGQGRFTDTPVAHDRQIGPLRDQGVIRVFDLRSAPCKSLRGTDLPGWLKCVFDLR